MHEALTPDDGANIENLNSVDSPQSSERAVNPFYSIVAGENKAKELLLLAPASKESSLNQAVDSLDVEEVAADIHTVEIIIDSQLNTEPQLDEENNENSDRDEWVAEPNVEQQAIVNTEFEKLLGLNEELRSANDKLYEQAEQLTNALSESEAALQRQNKRSTVAESMLKQQTSELNAAQAQIQSLFEQLENAVQNVQRQESIAESCKRQLELSQQRLAQLERECASIQNKYSEQTTLLSQSENACRELRTRLKRQQRQTLQFKAALEKSLETSVPSYDTLDDSDSNFPDITTNSHLNKFKQTQTINSIQSIKPWSAPLNSYKSQNNLWEEILETEAANNSENPIQESSTWEFTANPDIESHENTDDTQIELVDSPKVVNHDSVDEEVTVQISPSDSSELEEQLDSVIQTFFASQPESVSPQSSPEQDAETDESTIPIWKTLIEPSGTSDRVVNVETHQNFPQEEQTVSFTSSMNQNYTNELQDYWEEVSQFPAFELSENPASIEILSDTDTHENFPSPLIYPKRPPKRRKSLASVELPKFPHKSDGENG
ncbi:MAG: hypothetical protein WBA41_17200 [Rivularia sp. (in: cyanobacteria)]